MKGCKISPLGLGCSLGILWGLTILILGLLAHFHSFGKLFVETMANVYVIYTPSVLGSILGGIVGFINAFIIGALIAWIYNICSCCGCVCHQGKSKK